MEDLLLFGIWEKKVSFGPDKSYTVKQMVSTYTINMLLSELTAVVMR